MELGISFLSLSSLSNGCRFPVVLSSRLTDSSCFFVMLIKYQDLIQTLVEPLLSIILLHPTSAFSSFSSVL